MLNRIHFTSCEEVFHSLRCSDNKCSASSSRGHSLALESKSQEGCKGISRVSPPPPQTGACQEFTHHLHHKAEFVLLQPGPSSACVSLLNVPISSPLLQLKTEHFILSNFQVHHKLPQDAQGSFSTQRNVPVTLAHILGSGEKGEGVPWHFLNGPRTNRVVNWNQLKNSEMLERDKIQQCSLNSRSS